MELTLSAYAGPVSEGRQPSTDPPHAFVIGGLPDDLQAFVANWGAPIEDDWKVLTVRNGVQGDWSGEYDSRDAAVLAVRRWVARAF